MIFATLCGINQYQYAKAIETPYLNPSTPAIVRSKLDNFYESYQQNVPGFTTRKLKNSMIVELVNIYKSPLHIWFLIERTSCGSIDPAVLKRIQELRLKGGGSVQIVILLFLILIPACSTLHFYELTMFSPEELEERQMEYFRDNLIDKSPKSWHSWHL